MTAATIATAPAREPAAIRTTVGKKVLVALSGILFIGFVFAHFIRGDVYHNVVNGFQRVPVTIVYLFAMVALGMHLYHGTWSTFQTLGINRKRFDTAIRSLALGLALLIPIGYSLVPVAVLFR